MHLLYPSDSLNPKAPEEQYLPEIVSARSSGFEVSYVSLEYLQMEERRIFPVIPAGSCVLYRGYMLDQEGYVRLSRFVNEHGSEMHTSVEDYLGCHHLPNWYPAISDLTMETRVFPESCDLVSELKQLNWPGFFLKDYVKSLKTGSGSAISNPEEATEVVANMKKYRGQIEGGFCVRRLVDMEAGNEIRFFVVHGQPFSVQGVIPEIVVDVAKRMRSPFFSVDLAKTSNGDPIVIEVGDGQVSDTVGWDVQRFVEILPRSSRRAS